MEQASGFCPLLCYKRVICDITSDPVQWFLYVSDYMINAAVTLLNKYSLWCLCGELDCV